MYTLKEQDPLIIRTPIRYPPNIVNLHVTP